jgi:hypothetical protein
MTLRSSRTLAVLLDLLLMLCPSVCLCLGLGHRQSEQRLAQLSYVGWVTPDGANPDPSMVLVAHSYPPFKLDYMLRMRSGAASSKRCIHAAGQARERKAQHRPEQTHRWLPATRVPTPDAERDENNGCGEQVGGDRRHELNDHAYRHRDGYDPS